MKTFVKEEYNRLFAEFLGYKLITPAMRKYPDEWYNSYWGMKKDDGTVSAFSEDTTKFYSDWNWIMQVVEKIENLKTETSSFRFYINPKSVIILEDKNYSFEIGDGGISSWPLYFNGSIYTIGKSKKEAVVQAIWNFLNWYNENK